MAVGALVGMTLSEYRYPRLHTREEICLDRRINKIWIVRDLSVEGRDGKGVLVRTSLITALC